MAGANGSAVPVDYSLPTVASVLFDAVFIPGGAESTATLGGILKAVEFVEEAFKHCKAIAATGSGVDFLKTTRVASAIKSAGANAKGASANLGVVVAPDNAVSKVAAPFIELIAQHRVWEREETM